MRSARKALAAMAALAGGASGAWGQSITTLFATNNSGSAGGAVYFNITVGSTPIVITGLDVNTLAASGTAFGCQVYTHPGTFAGTETNAAAWTQRTTGVGTSAGSNNPSPVEFSSRFGLAAGATHAVAITLGAQGSAVAASHAYTNGTGSNQNFSNSDIALALGTASNVAFTAPVLSPRVWNGTVYYTFAGGCCLEDGTCSLIDAASCQSENGVYRGDGVTCAQTTCACTVLNNGGFESGSFSGWTTFGDTSFSGITTGAVVHSGLQTAFFGPVGDTGGISQVVPAAAGSPVVVSFWYQSSGSPQSFSVDLGPINLFSVTNDTTHGTWSEFSIPVVCPVANPVLKFTFRDDPAFIFLDDVRVCVGQPGCYANCDFSTTPPILNVQDFNCFLNKFAAGCP